MSAKTGLPPARIIALALDENVKLGRITSSPGFIIQEQESSKAAVPDPVGKTYFDEVIFFISLANFLLNSKSPIPVPERIAVMAAFSSSFPQKGLCSGIKDLT